MQKKIGEDYAGGVKVIEKLGPAGIPPVIHSIELDKEKAQKIKVALMEMHQDEVGRRILDKAYLQKFIEVEDSNYDDVRKWHQMAVDNNFMEIK